MKKQQRKIRPVHLSEQGMALVAALMCLLLCTGLGMAILFNSTGEASLSGGFRRNEQAFYGADAGLGITRMALRNSLNSAIQALAASVNTTPTYGSRTTGGLTLVTYDRVQLGNILQSSSLLSQTGDAIVNAKAALTSRANALTNAGFSVDIQLSLESITATSAVDLQQVVTNSQNVNVVQDIPSVTASVTGRYKYTVTSTGNNAISAGNPNRAEAKAIESGYISITLNATITTPTGTTSYSRSFSEYGTFVSRFSGVWAPGTFQGKVHTNQGFGFSSSNPVTFVGDVTQVNANYTHNGNSYTVSSVQPNSTPQTGMTFNSSYTTVASLPLPVSSTAQKLAVLNSTGLADNTYPSTTSDPTEPPDPTVTQMKAVLKTAANAAPATTGTGASETINTGVYVPASGTPPTISGGGIYVKGTADEITLSIGTNDKQIYTIKQGSTTTTITVTAPSGNNAGSTVVSNGTSSTTFQGVPMDKTDPTTFKPGVALYVDGAITSLHGPAASSGTVPAAVAKDTRLTIISTGDIGITGSITYQEPVLNSSGSTVTYANNYVPQNVLGLYTNSGKVTWTPNATYTGSNASMDVDAAMAIFNEAALTADSSATTGGWNTNCAICNSSTKLALRGSRTASKALGSTSYGQTTNRFFDPRFANGSVTPPFFPTTKVTSATTVTTRTAVSSTSQVMTQSNTWQRTYN